MSVRVLNFCNMCNIYPKRPLWRFYKKFWRYKETNVTTSNLYHLSRRENSVPCISAFPNFGIFSHIAMYSTSVESKVNRVSRGKQDVKIDMSSFPTENIRNFGIIAHVDHGKSTLSDRLMEFTGMEGISLQRTGTISKDQKNEQVLDKLPVERERGITVKAQTVSLFYEHKDTTYLLNLIDTPGHVDFSYEVARSLAACQGVVLLVDANQGVQAQTVAHFNLAFCSDLTIIPVLNKVDLKNANPDGVASQLEKLFSMDKSEVIKVSAKLGLGIEELLTSIIERMQPPDGDIKKPFRACLFDFWFDRYRGVIALIAVKDGKIVVGDHVVSHATKLSYEIREIGILHPEETPVSELCAGQVGYVVLNMRNIEEAKIGDTLHVKDTAVEPLFKIEPAKAMVYAGVYPMDQSQNVAMRSSIEKLLLNDSSVTVAIEHSPALGQGWRLGFLGLLHMEVFCQRLDQEFDAQVVITAPSVTYKAKLIGEKNIKMYGKEMVINNPLKFPDRAIVSEYLEPVVLGTIITPDKYLGPIVSLCMDRRGVQKSSQNIDNSNIMLQFKFPLSEVIVDFYDELKSLTSGYASFDYEDLGYEPTDLTKLHMLLNGKIVEELTTIVHTSRAQRIGRAMCLRLKETIPPQLFVISIQASCGGKVIARENIKAYRKDVLAKCHASDLSRIKKLLKRQAEGKKRMRMIGNVEVPRDAFIKVLKR